MPELNLSDVWTTIQIFAFFGAFVYYAGSSHSTQKSLAKIVADHEERIRVIERDGTHIPIDHITG